jgi:hypothetical protein
MKFWEYNKRVYGGPHATPFVSRTIVSPLFEAYLNTGHWWSYSFTVGNRWVLAVTARVTRGESISLRLDFLKLGQLEFMVWWPGV